MQSNKSSSRKPREAAADAAGTQPEAGTAGPVKKARKTTASSGLKASKKESPTDAAPAKRHRKTAVSDAAASPLESSATTVTGEGPIPARAMAAASGAGAGSFHSDVVESTGNMTEPRAMGAANAPANEAILGADVRQEEIAALAHSYWAARGYQHGSHEEDWLRAERELKSQRR